MVLTFIPSSETLESPLRRKTQHAKNADLQASFHADWESNLGMRISPLLTALLLFKITLIIHEEKTKEMPA